MLVIPVGFLALMWLEVALVRSVHHREPYSHALIEALWTVGAKPLTYVTIAFCSVALVLFSELFFGGLGAVAPSPPSDAGLWPAVWAGSYGQLITTLLAAICVAFFDLTRLIAYLALSMDDSGELPRRPVPDPSVAPKSTAMVIATADLVADDVPLGHPPK
jgi:hypothetical protein